MVYLQFYSKLVDEKHFLKIAKRFLNILMIKKDFNNII